MSESQKQPYKAISDCDRNRFEMQKRNHKQCLANGGVCTCIDALQEQLEEASRNSQVQVFSDESRSANAIV